MVVAYLSKKTLSAWLAIFYLIPFISKHCLRLRFGSDKCDCELLSFRPIQRINRRRWHLFERLPISVHKCKSTQSVIITCIRWAIGNTRLQCWPVMVSPVGDWFNRLSYGLYLPARYWSNWPNMRLLHRTKYEESELSALPGESLLAKQTNNARSQYRRKQR